MAASKVNPRNPLKADPTRTATLRRVATEEHRRRFKRVAKALRKLLVEEDAFGLQRKNRSPFVSNQEPGVPKFGAVMLRTVHKGILDAISRVQLSLDPA